MLWPDDMTVCEVQTAIHSSRYLIQGATRLPEYSCVLSALPNILDDDASRQFQQSSMKRLTLNQTSSFHLPASPITSSGSYFFLILRSRPKFSPYITSTGVPNNA